MIAQIPNLEMFIAGFLAGTIVSSIITYLIMKKTDVPGEKNSALQMLNVAILVVYIMVNVAARQQPSDAVMIAMLGFLFGEPLGRVIAGGRDDKKN